MIDSIIDLRYRIEILILIPYSDAKVYFFFIPSKYFRVFILTEEKDRTAVINTTLTTRTYIYSNGVTFID